jgi:hypothetical protein
MSPITDGRTVLAVTCIDTSNYLFQLNVHFLMFLESFLLFAQHVSNITASIMRSTTVVYEASL